MASGSAAITERFRKHLESDVPNPRQILFFLSQKKQILYGGAKGGGKSWAMRRKFVLLACKYKDLKLLLLRRTLPELRENHIIPLRAELEGYAKYNDDEKAFTFPSGSRIKLGYCDSDADVLQYQGQEYDVVGFEEAGLFTEYMLTEIGLCARNARPDFTPRIYYTANPGGPGHAYLKRIFVDRNFTEDEVPDDYEFIPAKVTDNVVLMKNSPEYLQKLNALPEDRRRALRDGDWDVFEGQYFPEFRRELHVIEPFLIPREWNKCLTIDYGFDMLAAYWIATDIRGVAYVYREVYQSDLLPSGAAEKMKAAMRFNSIGAPYKEGEPPEYLYQQMAPPDLFARTKSDTGESVVEMLNNRGWNFSKSKNDRVQGWYSVKEWLMPRPVRDLSTGEEKRLPGMFIFSTCKNLIRCLPLLQHDPKDPNDVCIEPHEPTHGPDALRYWATGRPQPTEGPVTKKARARWEEDQYEDYYSATPEVQAMLLEKWGNPF
jgi:phage terminase large subunit